MFSEPLNPICLNRSCKSSKYVATLGVTNAFITVTSDRSYSRISGHTSLESDTGMEG